MTVKKEKNISKWALAIFSGMEIGDRVECLYPHGEINLQRWLFNKDYPDVRLVIVKSKFKEGVNIIMRAE